MLAAVLLRASKHNRYKGVELTAWVSLELARYAYSFVCLFEMLTVKLLRLKLITMCL